MKSRADRLIQTLEKPMYSDSVIPFYSYNNDKKKYQSVGSAVLVMHRTQMFFITAAHVMESLKGEKTFIYFEKTFYEVGGLPAFLSDCSIFPSRDDDPLDLAAIPLPEGLVKDCILDKFITIDKYLAGNSVPSPLFQAIGFPHSRNTKAVNKTAKILGEFRSEGMRYTVTDVSARSFPYKNFCERYHIATCLTKTGQIQGARTHADIPDLHGISGGLLQKVTDYNPTTDGFDIAYPAGIILEKKRDNSALFSLRLAAVFEWLDIHWEYLQTLRSIEPAQEATQSD
ncbi:hypothetical protein QN372_07410 [Undibacterium sp. RTI2.1]|uniref:hypothetical protein n=1 Tax=unclassified Undibacterium TaxID=2630295 RepID=UPI002B2352D9|nr:MULTISPECIES: hypothetical protein [unclassified Undibacterium]MEB0030565.1 hypothetical protein [Undibacterium sp. RTI2.1]MEB0116934.1 hypothetical protein [Undibacterium sp. RTI2.2]